MNGEVLRFRESNGIPPESPCLDGHFTGNPIVPGAVILAHLSHHLARHGLSMGRIERMKFKRPLLPSRPFAISVAVEANSGKVDFTDDEGSFAAARITLRPTDG